MLFTSVTSRFSTRLRPMTSRSFISIYFIIHGFSKCFVYSPILDAGAPEDDKLEGGGGGGHIFIYLCYAQLISFEIEIKILKSIIFTVCEQEYTNMSPPPIIDLPAPLSRCAKQNLSKNCIL